MPNWVAKIRNVKDVGNGSGDVTVDFMCDEQIIKTKCYNFHAGSVTLESGREIIERELRDLKEFSVLSQQVMTMIGLEITLPEDIEENAD